MIGSFCSSLCLKYYFKPKRDTLLTVARTSEDKIAILDSQNKLISVWRIIILFLWPIVIVGIIFYYIINVFLNLSAFFERHF
jgi:hypothetical protein